MARRRMAVKRIDPWSMLKFGFIANIVFLAIFLMLLGVVWFIVDRLQLIDQICGIATDVGFTECGISPPNLFRSMILLGLLWVVVQTATLVFLAFLYNLIADLTGGIGLTIVDDSLPASSASTGAAPRTVATAGHQPVASREPTASTGPPAAPLATERTGSQTPERQPAQRASGPARDVSSDASTSASRTAPRQTTDEDLFDSR